MKRIVNNSFKAFSLLLIIALLIASLTSCNKDVSEHFYVYGTFLEVTSSSTSDNQNVYKYVESLEGVLSPTVEGSDIYKINHSQVNEKIVCHSETMDIMKIAEKVYQKSNGAYDPSVYPLVRLWNFSSDKYLISTDIPSDKQIEDTLKLVGLSKAFEINYDDNSITKLVEGAMLDFGGVAKGYVAEKSREKLSTKGLINLGGNITGKDSSFSIGIGNPSREDRPVFRTSYFCKLTLDPNMCIATSGDYERYYEVDGVIYNHIINPYTGRPQDTSNSIISCSIISSDGAIGDAVATAVIVLGKEEGIKLINSLNIKAVIIDSSYNLTTIGIQTQK